MRQRNLQTKNASFLIIAVFLILPLFVFGSLSLTGCESKKETKDILAQKKPPRPGLKSYLGGLAWIDNEGWIYPNQVDRDGAGRPLYNLGTDPEHAFLAKMEANNAGDIDLYTRVSWRTCSGTKEGAAKRMEQIIDNDGIRVIEKYMIVDIKYEGDKAFVYYRQNGSEQVLMSQMMKINGEWQFS